MDADSMIEALRASGPHPELAEHLVLFGQFVGAWDVDVTNIAADGTRTLLKGEWHFGWALEGWAIIVLPEGKGHRSNRWAYKNEQQKTGTRQANRTASRFNSMV